MPCRHRSRWGEVHPPHARMDTHVRSGQAIPRSTIDLDNHILSVFSFLLTHRGADVISHPTKHARCSRSTTRSLFPQDALPPPVKSSKGRKSKTRPLTWVYYTSDILSNEHLDIFLRNLPSASAKDLNTTHSLIYVLLLVRLSAGCNLPIWPGLEAISIDDETSLGP